MHNASQPAASSHATEILKNIASLLVSLAQDAESCDLSLLDSIATTASQVAQDVRLEEARLLAECERFEEEESERFACDPDTREDRFLDSYWESLTDVGDFGGGDF